MRILFAFVFVLMSGFFVTQPAPAQDALASPLDEIYGQEWILRELRGYMIIDKPVLSLKVDRHGGVYGHGGCNGFGGRISLGFANTDASVTELMTTERSCRGWVMYQETRYFDALTQAKSYRLNKEGDLCLTDGTGKDILRFTAAARLTPEALQREKEVAAAASAKVPPLFEKEWQLQSIRGRDIIRQTHPSFYIDTDGRLNGGTGCNHMFGKAMVIGDVIQVGAMSSTRRACVYEEVTKQEDAYTRALDYVRYWRVTDDKLELLDSEGSVILRFIEDKR